MGQRRQSVSMFDNPVLIGAIVALLLVFAYYVSYNANRGLPFVPTYRVKVDIVAGQKLNPGDAVKEAGARIGQVLDETAEPPVGTNKAYVQLTLALGVREKLPVDSQFEIRPQSVLGEKYVSVTKGKSKYLMPAGGTFTTKHVIVETDFDQALSVFNPQTRSGIQQTIDGFGDGVAGRSSDLSSILTSLSQLEPASITVSKTFTSSKADLPGLINGIDQLVLALSPVSGPFGQFWGAESVTFGALAKASQGFGATLDDAPSAEAVSRRALISIRPVLANAATIATDFEPGAKLLPSVSNHFADALVAGTPVLKNTPSVASTLNNLNAALTNVLPPKTQALADDFNDLDATFGSLGQTLQAINPSQEDCNVMGVLLRNVASTLGSGNSYASSVMADVLLAENPNDSNPQPGLPTPTAQPSTGLNVDTYPNENSTECDAGREIFNPNATTIGTPTQGSAIGTQTDSTAPPQSVTALAQSSGLLTPPAGARP